MAQASFSAPTTTPGGPAAKAGWLADVDRRQWRPLIAANLGWLFDGYETYALILTVAVALKQVLPASDLPRTSFFAGATIALTLLGWGVGGILGGIAADYIGRRRTMIYAMLLYATFTGLSALSWSWWSLAGLRFLTGIAMGSEWGTGTALVAETWPDRLRAKAAGVMQSGLGIGFFIASAVWYFVAPLGPSSWRIMFLVGVLPALVALWIRRGVPESQKWQQARRNVVEASAATDHNAPGRQRLAPATVREIFGDPKLRRLTLLGSLMSLATTLGWWGISTWVPVYVGTVAGAHGKSPTHWASVAGMLYNAGAIAGYIGLGFLADRLGRKPTVMVFFAMSFVLTPVLFLWTHNLALVLGVVMVNGFFTLGQYSWMPVWLPEFYPTRVRGTGVALVFNLARFVAWTGPLLAGTIISALGGYGVAATTLACIYLVGLVVVPLCPETRGRPLPAD